MSDAERARRDGDSRAAYNGYVEAGHCAERYGLWKTALRCYRSAVEVDLFSPTAVNHLARIAGRAGAGGEWGEYAVALAPIPAWPSITCRQIQLSIGGSGAVVSCTR